MEATLDDTVNRRAPISVLALGVVVVLYAFAWYVMYVYFEEDVMLKLMVTPFFMLHALLGVGIFNGWSWARWLVIGIASIGMLVSLYLMLSLGQTDAFMFYLLALFLAALIVLVRKPAREYFRQAPIA